MTLHRWSAGWSLGVKGSFSLRASSLSSNFGRQHEPQPPVLSEPSAAANDHFEHSLVYVYVGIGPVVSIGGGSPTLPYSVHSHTVWL